MPACFFLPPLHMDTLSFMNKQDPQVHHQQVLLMLCLFLYSSSRDPLIPILPVFELRNTVYS